jgi:bifunctional polynucleotide phosphatase/kinase
VAFDGLIIILILSPEQAVQNFFTPISQKPKEEKLSWRILDNSCISGKYNPTVSGNLASTVQESGLRKIAAFDFDSTLISTVSKARHARDANDWCWWHGSVPGKLKSLHEQGYLLVILSNQAGISLRNKDGPKLKADRSVQFKQKAGAVFNNLNLPMSIYAATEKDRFRKPMTGMWDTFLKDKGLNIDQVCLENSVFVGDAGGRIAGIVEGKTVKADFACSDRNMADNLGLKFQTPEEYFLDQPPREWVRTFDPASFMTISEVETRLSYDDKFTKRSSPEVIVFVGTPGAGKSSFFKKHLEPLGYQRANQDTLKSRERCIKLTEDCLGQGKSVVIDNTNPDPDVRKIWISLAKKFNAPVRCVWFNTDKEVAKHNDVFRALSGLQQVYRCFKLVS